jgi:hypothetical protein
MKNTFTKFTALSLLFFFIITASCKKKAEIPTVKPLEGFQYTDNFGNNLVAYGDVSDDWTFTDNLSAKEKALFDFPDLIDMTGTLEVSIPIIYPAYPNPARTYIGFTGRFGTSPQVSKLKVVITDGFLNVALRDAILVSGTEQFFFGLTNNQIFQPRGTYRIYYSLSAEGKPNYKMGYGDFQICPGFIPLPNCP